VTSEAYYRADDIRERLYANYVSDVASDAPDVPKWSTLVTMLAAEADSVGSRRSYFPARRTPPARLWRTSCDFC
jgi:hypothetical protein